MNMKLIAAKKEFKFKNTDTLVLFLGEKGNADYKKTIPDEFSFSI